MLAPWHVDLYNRLNKNDSWPTIVAIIKLRDLYVDKPPCQNRIHFHLRNGPTFFLLRLCLNVYNKLRKIFTCAPTENMHSEFTEGKWLMRVLATFLL